MPEIVMGKKSGVDNITLWSEKLGIELSEDEKMAVLNQVKLRSHDLKRTLTESEFKKIAKQVKPKKK
jgi:isopropylmalate/homocitrate/citramalate synthase